MPPSRVLGIAKLKCLNYLIRTFGVRNMLPTLLGDGGRDAVENGAYDAALEHFEKGLVAEPGNVDLLLAFADLLPYDRFALRFEPADLKRLPALLRALRPRRLALALLGGAPAEHVRRVARARRDALPAGGRAPSRAP